MDYTDFVVHIFSPEKRSYYELERLWADAPRIQITGFPAVNRSRLLIP